jgi:PAS domain S-box-containing protein
MHDPIAGMTQQLDRTQTARKTQSFFLRFLRGALPLLAYTAAWFISYYVNWPLAFALHPKIGAPSPLNAQNAVTIAALLLTPRRRWWPYLLLIFPLTLLVFWLRGIPPSPANVALYFTTFLVVAGVSVITVGLLRRFTTSSPRFASVSEVGRFTAIAAIAALYAGVLVTALRTVAYSFDPLTNWQIPTLGHALAIAIFTPALVLWLRDGWGGLGLTSRERRIEFALLGLSTVALSLFVFATRLPDEGIAHVLIYIMIPVLIWAAVSFGPQGLASTLTVTTIIAITGAALNDGPFVAATSASNALALQLFLLFVGVPLFFLAALVEERKQALVALRASEARYRTVVRNLPHTAVLLFDEELRHQFADGPGLGLLGLTAPQVERRTIWETLPGDLADTLAPLYQAAISGQEAALDVEHAPYIFRVQVATLPPDPTSAATASRPRGMAVLREVTEQRRARDELEHERTHAALLGALSQELRALAEHSPDLIARLDPRGRILYINPAGADLLGRPVEDWLGKTLADAGVPREVSVGWAQELREVMVSRAPQIVDADIQTGPGEQPHSLHIRLVPEIGEEIDSSPLRSVLVIATDITALKQAQTRVEEQAGQLEAIFGAMADGVVVVDRHERVTHANWAWKEMFQQLADLMGMSREPSFATLSFADQIARWIQWQRMNRYQPLDTHGDPLPPQIAPTYRALQGETVTGDNAVDERVEAPDGRVYVVNTSSAPVRDAAGAIIGAVTVGRDVTTHRELERQVREQAAELEAIFGAMADGVAVFDLHGRCVRGNAALRTLLGLGATGEDAAQPPQGEARRLQMVDERGAPLPEERWPLWRVLRGETLAGEGAVETEARAANGRELTISTTGAPIRALDGQIIGSVLITREVTARRELERQAREQAAALEAIFNAMTDGVGVFDVHGGFVRANTALHQLLGLAADSEYTARPLVERAEQLRLFDEQGHPLAAEDWPHWKVMRGEVFAGAGALELRVRTLDGREVWTSITGAPIRAPDGLVTGCVLIMRDVTARREFERRLQEHVAEAATEAERSRIARELHDTVTQDLYAASVLAESIPKVWIRNREQAERALGQLHELTRSGLATLRLLLLEMLPGGQREIGLPTLLRQLLDAMRTRAGAPLSLVIEGDEGAWLLLPQEVKQALYRMAQEAVTNAVKYASASQIVVRLRRGARGTLRMEIADDGVGFDPFASAPGHFGLTIMRERAKAMGATVQVKSQIGKGTRVVLAWRRIDMREDSGEVEPRAHASQLRDRQEKGTASE